MRPRDRGDGILLGSQRFWPAWKTRGRRRQPWRREFLKLIYPTPTPVASELTFVAITTGEAHSCGLAANGAAYCWGFNGEGALGSSSSQDSWLPVLVSGGHTFRSIQAGRNHTCALTESGAAYCWGRNSAGQTGTGDPAPSIPTPTAVSGGLIFTELAAGSTHTCGLTADGSGYCWGESIAVGAGDRFGPAVLPTPHRVSGGLSFASIAAGDDHNCGQTRDGEVYCWGSNSAKQLGNDAPCTDGCWSETPVLVASTVAFALIGSGGGHTCALDASGAAWCWGDNTNAQVGVGSATPAPFATPQRVVGSLTFDRLSVGYGHSCARTTAGAWYCWGANESGVLGIGTTTTSGTPLKILGQK